MGEVAMLSCRFCGQEIYETETTPGVNGPVHMRGKFRHVEEDALHCNEISILPNAPKPTCNVCGTDGASHKVFCSFAGKPRAKAKP